MKTLFKPVAVVCVALTTMLGGFNLQAQNDAVKKEAAKQKTVKTESVNQDVQKSKKSSKPAEISFETLTHDYGKMQVNANGDCKFVFTNTGKEPLIVSKVQGCCGVSVVDWTKDPVMPKKEGVIALRYNTKRPVTINKTVTVFSNDPNNPEIKLLLKGQVIDNSAAVSTETSSVKSEKISSESVVAKPETEATKTTSVQSNKKAAKPKANNVQAKEAVKKQKRSN